MNLSPEMMQMLASYGPILFMGFVFYFLLYRPQKKEQQRRTNMLDSLKKGDRVITAGGIHGAITALTEKLVTIKIADKVEINVSRTAISVNESDTKNNPKK
ncbi:preprotein translocase subunit YajC [Dendrosporobacter quercicolus]|uniref:Preprotein translocase subunit YajC n=2 Tax=Dendrosporobacter quercicolus TaxID=146817 RepID=A0A1G9KPP1_9FIRM|nr:preprotein translocase subunit YajC [Dendrosporobacter quercicolus]